jgi:hypothetical protein
MKKLLLVAAILGLIGEVAGQSYGNEWIHYDRQYWYFRVWQDGIRRIDSTTLANAGFPLATVDPRTIELYNRGRQVPIHVEGEEDGVFNGGDFIEFYGRKNDCWMDSSLWEDPAYINNPYYSMYNDTIRYYLTWGSQTEALRTIGSGSGNWAAYSPLPWVWATTVVQYTQFWQNGKRTSVGASESSFGDGEGYFHSISIQTEGPDTTRSYAIGIPSLYTGADAPPSTYKVAITSLNNSGGSWCPDHHLRVEHAGAVYADTVFQGYHLLKYSFEYPASTVSGGATETTFRLVHDLSCQGLAPDYLDAFAIGWNSIRYPRNIAFGVTTDLEVPASNGMDSTLLSFAGGPGVVVYAWAPDGLHRIDAVLAGGTTYKAILPPSPVDMHVAVYRPAGITGVEPLRPVNGSGEFTDFSADIPDSALVIITHPELMAAAQQYAAYRETNPHNRYNTLVTDVEQLYDQFGGGIRLHPLAIRNYMRYVYDHAAGKPQGLFLIGKSVKAVPTGGLDYQRGYRRDTLATKRCLVPTIGWPSSDMQYGLNLSGNQPTYLSVPVGRLAAMNSEQVLDYLAKVDSVESQPLAAWMKNILHFRGGSTQNEWNQFDAALESYRVIAEDSLFYGHVTKFVKNGSDVISPAAVDSVTDMIAQGVTLMTFFGHASGGGFDITIDNPLNYDWHGKFPVVIGNSCYTGNLHQYEPSSSSEQFVLPHNAGALAFLSSVDIGLATYLQQYTRDFYESFSRVNYGRSIGTHMRYAVQDQLTQGGVEHVNNAETMTLHGDPMLVMNSPKLPELEVTLADVSTIPTQVTADVDSFQVRVIFRNVGRGTGQPFPVALERTLVGPGITLPAVVQEVAMNSFQDTVYFNLPMAVGQNGTGINDLQVRLDLDPGVIPEEDDFTNNQVTLRININVGDLLPVEPYDFAIVSQSAPTLKASTGDPFAPPRTYIFQIDTTDRYDSPVMEQHSLVAPGGVVEWQPTSIYALNAVQDSVVYFWRCTLDSAGQGAYNWHEFSFQHITGRQGWGQAHFAQFKNDGFSQIVQNQTPRRFEFEGGTGTISCHVRGGSLVDCYWLKGLDEQEGQGNGPYPSINVAVVDPFDFSSWMTRYGGTGRYYGQSNYDGHGKPRQEASFVFWSNVMSQMVGLGNMLSDAVPDGHYILVYTYIRLERSVLDASGALDAFAELGATNLADGTVPSGVPYIFFCRKGDPSSVQELWGDSATAILDLTVPIPLNVGSGSILAPRSNPALGWDGLSWRMVPTAPADSSRIQLYGVVPQGTEVPVLDLPGYSGDIDLQPLLSADQFPQLRIKGRFWNDTAQLPMPAQLRRWQLLGMPAPECAIDPPSGYYIHLDSLFQAEQAAVMVSVRNIGQEPMDSLLLSAIVTDHANQGHLVHYKRNAPLPVGGVLQDTIRFDTQLFPGPNSITIEANPVDTATNLYDQPEQYHFNNIATLRFLTLQDLENPVLDVTFDGIHILDGDIVSARPEIQVTLDDENQTLLLDQPSDTAYFKVFLTDPSGATNRIYFRQGGEEVMQFVPATGPDNVSKIFYRPVFAVDGKYRIAVRASDKSHNNSGDRDNAVDFEVINKPTITEVLNYPNPFTTSTRFVFTLTGHEVPTAMRIQIMTITGRVVRDIPMSELGPLHVGRNITEFAWDGTDQFGDRLARGVYLYRVLAQLHGQDIEYRDGGAGSYFTKGFGKMYLLH